MFDPVDRVVRTIARRNSYALVWAQFGPAHLVMFGGMGLLTLFQRMSAEDFWLFVGVSQSLVALDNVISIRLTRRMWTPVRAWERGARDEASPLAAWRCLATLPLEYVRTVRKYPFVFSYLPFMAFVTWKLHLPWYSFFILSVVGSVVMAYGLIVRYFSIEVVTRPVIEEVSKALPSDFKIDAPGLPLRWRLFAAAPIINVITGVVVAGLSTRGHHASLSDLGLAWLIAVAVSFTISLELVVLVVRSLGSSLADLSAPPSGSVRGSSKRGCRSSRLTRPASSRSRSTPWSRASTSAGDSARRSAPMSIPDSRTEFCAREPTWRGRTPRSACCSWTSVTSRPSPSVPGRPRWWRFWWSSGSWSSPLSSAIAAMPTSSSTTDCSRCSARLSRCPITRSERRPAALEIVGLVRERYGNRVEVGIGVNSGRVIAGTVGGGGRVEFTVIGYAVNTAARVEAATRATGDDVLITEATKELLPREQFEFEARASVPLKGKQVQVRLWAPRMLPDGRLAAEDGRAAVEDGHAAPRSRAPVPD